MKIADTTAIEKLRNLNSLLAQLTPDAMTAAETELSQWTPQEIRSFRNRLEATRELAVTANQYWELRYVQATSARKDIPAAQTSQEFDCVG